MIGQGWYKGRRDDFDHEVGQDYGNDCDLNHLQDLDARNGHDEDECWRWMSSLFWQIFNHSHIQSYSVIFDHIWLYSVIFSHFQLYSVIFSYSHIQSYLVIFSHIQSYSIIFGHIQSYSVIFSHIQSYSVIFSHSHI